VLLAAEFTAKADELSRLAHISRQNNFEGGLVGGIHPWNHRFDQSFSISKVAETSRQGKPGSTKSLV
jgi:hypothetical protein